MINGGGSVVLEFSRNRMKTQTLSVHAGWNQFVHLDPVVIYLIEDMSSIIKPEPCAGFVHNSTWTYPIVKTSWKEVRSYYENLPVLPDSGVVRVELNIVDTNLKLVYVSSLASGFSSTIYVLLTQSKIPENLQLVHLHIMVEGVVHKQTFDANPDMRYEYSWDRRNAYEQRVYGLTTAKVMIGYEYEQCSYIYWHTSVVKLAGYDLGSSEIGNWNIDVHHRLNTQQGILHKGDGTTVYLKELQKSIEIVAGQIKSVRDVECSQCQFMTDAGALKFYMPYSLSINKDGLIFIADHNFIWMLNNTESPRRIVELRFVLQ
jgi:teneurin